MQGKNKQTQHHEDDSQIGTSTALIKIICGAANTFASSGFHSPKRFTYSFSGFSLQPSPEVPRFHANAIPFTNAQCGWNFVASNDRFRVMLSVTTFANQRWFQALPVPTCFLSGGVLTPRAPSPKLSSGCWARRRIAGYGHDWRNVRRFRAEFAQRHGSATDGSEEKQPIRRYNLR